MTNIKKIVLPLLAFAVAIGISVPASAQFSSQLGGLAGLSGEANFNGNARDIDAELNKFNEKNTENNRLVFNALRAIRIAYEDAAGAEREAAVTKSFNKIIDPKEQKAKMEEIRKSDLARIEELKNSNETRDRTRKLGNDKQNQVVMGVEGFLIAAARATDLIKSGQSIIRFVSLSRMNMAKVEPVKEAIPILTDTKSAATNIFPEFINVLKGANLQVRQVTANPSSPNQKGQ
jgi:hypothetical protein